MNKQIQEFFVYCGRTELNLPRNAFILNVSADNYSPDPGCSAVLFVELDKEEKSLYKREFMMVNSYQDHNDELKDNELGIYVGSLFSGNTNYHVYEIIRTA